MKHDRLNILLCSLFLISLALNAWQFLRQAPAPEVNTVVHAVRTAATKGFAGEPEHRPSGERTGDQKSGGDNGAEAQHPGQAQKQLADLPEDELLFGAMNAGTARTHGEPSGRVTPERMKELSKQEPSKAERFRVQAVLHLPGDRKVELGASEIGPGMPLTIERVREFPFPTSIGTADSDPFASQSSFPVTPTTPGDFEVRNQGIVIEVDVTPAAGTLVLGGQVTHRTFEGFGRMPGEVFLPIYTKGVSETGGSEDVILTENKVLQPQFNVAETPFLAAATAGEPCRVPVRMTFGQTILELTCTPVE